MTQQDDTTQAAIEAAQNIVNDVTSYQYSAEDADIAAELQKGLDEAGVQVSEDEKKRLVEEIHQLRNDENGGTPQVTSASPKA